MLRHPSIHAAHYECYALSCRELRFVKGSRFDEDLGGKDDMHVKVLVYCILFLFSSIPIIGDRPQMDSDILYLYHKLGG